MTKVYIVTKGAYSDYRIITVFSTMEKAEAFVTALAAVDSSAYERPGVEEFDLDSEGTQVGDGYFFFEVKIKRNGDVVKVEKQSEDFGCWPYENLVSRPRSEYADMQMFARNEAHAAKIANERRAMLIANGEWEIKQ